MKKLFSSNYTEGAMSLALFLLRLTMGGLVIPHGYDKLMKYSTMSKMFADPFHIGQSTTLTLVIFAELFCGALVLMGLMTRLACIPLIISFTVAVFKAHNGQIFGVGEHAALFLGGFLTLLFSGPGRFSFDRLIGK
jgi:putative oxidoreductase